MYPFLIHFCSIIQAITMNGKYNNEDQTSLLFICLQLSVDIVSFKAQPFARQLLENSQGGQLKELQVYRGKSPQEHTLAEIVIHTSVALQCVGSGSLAQPLYALMTSPSTMKVRICCTYETLSRI